MSQQGSLTTAGSGAGPVETLTGNSGGPVSPDGAFNINILGNNTTGINVVGMPGANTLSIVGIQATTTQRGTVTLATNAETLTGTDTSKVLTPDDLSAKLGAQTLHGLPIGAGSTAALVWTASPTNGQLLIGSTGSNPALGNLTSTGGSITITNGPGTINLDLAGGGIAFDQIFVDASTAPGVNPVVPTGTGQLTMTGAQVATGIVGTNVIRTASLNGSELTVQIQRSTAVAATDLTKNGVSHFDSAAFDVDASGFVQLNGGGIAATSFDVQANTAPGTDPVVPTAAGVVTVNGAAVANHSVVLETRSRAANAYNLEVQYATSAAATDATKSGVAHFNSAQFSVDASGFVATSGTGILNTLTGNSGGALSPTAGNINTLGTGSITIAGAGSTLTTQLTGLTNHAVLIGAGTATITSVGPVASTGSLLASNGVGSDPGFTTATYPLTTTVSQILYSSATNTVTGLATANRAVLTTSATGVPVVTALATDGQLIIGSTAGAPAAASLTAGTGISITPGSNSISIAVNTGTVLQTLTGNSGGALSPTAGNISTLGTGSITIAGAGSTLTTQLTGLTNHALQVGAGTATLTQLGAGTTGQILQTNTTADPTWSTATYPSTTTISQILYSSAANTVSGLATANRAVLTTSATGVPVLTPIATNGTFIIGSTAGAPASGTITSTGGTITVTPGSNTINIDLVGGTTAIDSFSPDSGTDPVVPTAAGLVNMKGSGSITTVGSLNTLTTQLTGLTNHNVLVGAGTTTITNVAPSATSGVPLISQGAAADPTFGTAVVAGGGTGATSFTAYMPITGGTTTTGVLQSVATGTAGYALTYVSASGLPTWQPKFSTVNYQVFTSNGTYTPTSGMVYCIIECVGGGGGGGGAPNANAVYTAGSGGGGGEYASGIFSAATIGASKTVTIGAGGGGNSGTTGTAGGTTTVGSTVISAGGGAGGTSITTGTALTVRAVGAAGGSGGTGGSFRLNGGSGGIASVNSTGQYAISGFGGSSHFSESISGLTLLNIGSGQITTGNAATGYGGGGGGALGYATNSAASGGAGSSGIVVVTEYIT